MAADAEFLEVINRYNASRDLAGRAFYSVCYAPFVSLYFDQLGSVRVCCQNSKHTVGNIARQSLDEIWNGSKIEELRSALRSNELRLGCQFCEWQFLDGNSSGSFMRRFDEIPVQDPKPRYPQLMEFSISNTCNLECVMCNGEWSSLIRTRREKKPPLPKPYHDRFFEQLAEYLPHLRQVNILGGEPFLQQEIAKIWDLMIGLKLKTPCYITTNGTQWNSRVERVLDQLPCHLAISCDGYTKETLEAIRKNTKFEEWRANFQRFRKYADERQTSISINFCLMTANWHEFLDLLLFAEEHRATVCVNLVTHPVRYSLYHLSNAELAPIVEHLERQDARDGHRLTLNRSVWDVELTRLRQRMSNAEQLRSFHHWGYLFPQNPPVEQVAADLEQCTETLQAWSGNPPLVLIDSADNEWVDTVEVLDDTRTVVNWNEALGEHISMLSDLFARRFGWHTELLQFEQDDRRIDVIQSFGEKGQSRVHVRAMTIPRLDADGHRIGTRMILAVKDIAPPDVVAIEMPT